MTRKPSLLVVDDAWDVCEVLMSASAEIFEAECAYSGGEASQKLRQRQYDAILVDLDLPQIRGDDIAKAASSLGAVVVMMTGYSVEAELADCPFPAFQKPFHVAEVISFVLEAVMSQRRVSSASS
jgi:CheY-like chemotaxis protein